MFGNVSVLVPLVTLAQGLMYTSDVYLVGQVFKSLAVFWVAIDYEVVWC